VQCIELEKQLKETVNELKSARLIIELLQRESSTKITSNQDYVNRSDVSSGDGKVKCSQCKVTITSVSDSKIIRNGKKNLVKEELVKLNEEMKELVKQIKVVASSRVKEAIQQKVKEMIGK
jgi:hypothetical protein